MTLKNRRLGGNNRTIGVKNDHQKSNIIYGRLLSKASL